MPVPFTVTATQSGSTGAGMILRVKVLTGAAAAAAQTGATATQAGSAAHQASITPTQTGSVVYGAILSVNTTLLTAAAGTTLFDNILRSTIVYGSCRSTGTSTSGTPETVGASAPVSSGLTALAEILTSAGGTIAEDASSPAVANSGTTAATTAAFNPPPGSLLVAMVASNGGAGTNNIIMSDTSSPRLTWIALNANHPAASGTAYVFIAQVPVAPGSGSQITPLRRPPARLIAGYRSPGGGITVPPPVFPAGTVPPFIGRGTRRTTVRALTGPAVNGAGNPGTFLNVGPPATGGLVIPRRLNSIRGYRRGNAAPFPGIGKAVISGLVVPRRQDGKRPTWHSVPGTLPVFAPNGHVPPHIYVTVRPHVRAFLGGMQVLGAVRIVHPVISTGVQIVTGPVSLQWGTGPVSTGWVTGPVSTA